MTKIVESIIGKEKKEKQELPEFKSNIDFDGGWIKAIDNSKSFDFISKGYGDIWFAWDKDYEKPEIYSTKVMH